ncbi:TRIC cation channel family protein [Leptolyngbya cf. ectocarpi LEGE 11479]|uniref:TRIC cation channel family protein n=1 Tax=Leptolyngbya cf. ectocarpi LEGE 11479 TaxID=1828722 RepID=A0A928ZWM5_LEPEC|nr:TRIC cation channel family protein [Leptolyngbya ectocarpi]MBE9068806.1 TRIC cation channel family protein [Leptolyngbya cf. ectocarpi LEGE 11479]
MFCTPFLYMLDLFSTAVFAASGALVAREQHRNSLTAVGYAILTAVGGGTLRDIVLRQPIFWTKAPVYFLLAMSVGLSVFVFSAFARLRHRQLWLMDAIGLATFTIVGTQHVLQLPIAASLSLLMRWLPPAMGLMTGVGGGIVRDLLSRQMPYVLRNPGYAIASFTGGSVYYGLASLQGSKVVAIGVAIATVLFTLPHINKAIKPFF